MVISTKYFVDSDLNNFISHNLVPFKVFKSFNHEKKNALVVLITTSAVYVVLIV